MIAAPDLERLNEEQVRELAAQLLVEVRHKQAAIDKLTHEMAVLKRLRFAARSEYFSVEQRSLLEEDVEADLQALSREIEQLAPAARDAGEKNQPKRLPLPAHLPRRVILHEPHETTCRCGCALARIGEDVAEKLDYTPGRFTVERHIRGKWACAACETLVQAPVPAHIIDKGIPTAGLLAQVLVAKYQDHLPLYRQEGIFGRAGLAIPQSTLAQWVGQSGVHLQPLVDALKADVLAHPVLHADETPVAMLDPGAGKTHRAYLWSYSVGAFDPIKAVVYDFADSRAGRHAQAFLGQWRGTLICDDYAGYKALIAQGVTEAGCMAQYLAYGFIRRRGLPLPVGRSAASFAARWRCAQTPHNLQGVQGAGHVGGWHCRYRCGRNRVPRRTSHVMSGKTRACSRVRCIHRVAARSHAMAPMHA